ncbi:MAG: 50S ribosomal protein L35 [Actinomycetota bacterium]|nr:50S ribosomal protein L35 [Actinomycetota bacterium]
MPKMKPHSGMKKRVKVTGSGKLRRQKVARRTHLVQKQSSGRTRLDDNVRDVSTSDVPRVRKMLGR